MRVLASVPTVTDLFSLVNVVNLLSRRPCLSRKRDAGVALECETKMNVEGPPVKDVP